MSLSVLFLCFQDSIIKVWDCDLQLGDNIFLERFSWFPVKSNMCSFENRHLISRSRIPQKIGAMNSCVKKNKTSTCGSSATLDRFCLRCLFVPNYFSESATPGPTFYGRSPRSFVVVVVATSSARYDYHPLGACGSLGIARICCKVGASTNQVIRKWERHW